MYTPGLGVMYTNILDVQLPWAPRNGHMVPSLDTNTQKVVMCWDVSTRDVTVRDMDVCIVSPLGTGGSMFLAGNILVYRLGRFHHTSVDDMLRDDRLVSYRCPEGDAHACVQTASGDRVWVVEVESWHKTRIKDAVVTEFWGSRGTVVNESGFFVPSKLPK